MSEGGTGPMDDRVVDRRVLRVLAVHTPGSHLGAVARALAGQPRLNVIGEKPCDSSALAAVAAIAPDVVIIDASIGANPTGLRLAMSIKAALPCTGIVVLVERRELAALARAPKRQSPRCSFLLKDSIHDGTVFAKVTEGAASGLVAIDPLIVRALQNPYRQLLERLTSVQLTALELLAAGFSDIVIAEKLALTRRQAALLIRSVYEDLHITRDPSVHRRVKAALVFLSETSWLRT